MGRNIKNSIINFGSNINGSVTNNVTENTNTLELIKEIDQVIKNNCSTFNSTEIAMLNLAKENLSSGDIDAAHSMLKCFKTTAGEIAKLTITNVLSAYILKL